MSGHYTHRGNPNLAAGNVRRNLNFGHFVQLRPDSEGAVNYTLDHTSARFESLRKWRLSRRSGAFVSRQALATKPLGKLRHRKALLQSRQRGLPSGSQCGPSMTEALPRTTRGKVHVLHLAKVFSSYRSNLADNCSARIQKSLCHSGWAVQRLMVSTGFLQ